MVCGNNECQLAHFTVFAKKHKVQVILTQASPECFFSFFFLGKSSHLFLPKILQSSLQCPVFMERKDNVLVHV